MSIETSAEPPATKDTADTLSPVTNSVTTGVVETVPVLVITCPRLRLVLSTPVTTTLKLGESAPDQTAQRHDVIPTKGVTDDVR